MVRHLNNSYQENLYRGWHDRDIQDKWRWEEVVDDMKKIVVENGMTGSLAGTVAGENNVAMEIKVGLVVGPVVVVVEVVVEVEYAVVGLCHMVRWWAYAIDLASK